MARVETRLLTALEMVNDWLQFAEAKNVGMVALNALAVTTILGYLAGEDSMSQLLLVGLLLTILLLIFSLSTSLLSFMPRTDPTKLGRRKHSAPAETDNLYFYADLEKYRPEELASAVAHRYEGVTGYDPARHRSHVDLASQIIINSRIIMAKNRAFRTAAWFALAALASAVVSASLSLIFCR